MTAALLLGLALAGETVGVDASGDTAAIFRSHLAQAQFFAKRGWSADALGEIEAALATPEGALSWEAHWLGARLAWDLCDLDRALALGRRAADLAPDPAAAEAPASFVAGLERDMGWAVLDAPYPGMTSRLQLELTGLLFDPELQDYTDRLATRLRDRTPLPVRVGLPAGSYLVNGRELVVPAGGEARLALPMEAIGRRGLTQLQVARLELAAGTGLWFGERTGDLLPAARGSLGFTLPAGQVLLGPVFEGALQSYLADESVRAGVGWAAGARIGTEVFLGGPLAVRPSLLLRYGQIPGIGLACTEDAGGWDCAVEAPASGPVHHVYAAGRGIMPGAELLVEYREAGRTTALGTGVRVAVDYAGGNLAEQGVARDTDGNEYTWHTTDTAWSAVGFSMLANVGVAF